MRRVFKTRYQKTPWLQPIWWGWNWKLWCWGCFPYPRSPMTVPGNPAHYFWQIMLGPLELRIWDRRWRKYDQK